MKHFYTSNQVLKAIAIEASQTQNTQCRPTHWILPTPKSVHFLLRTFMIGASLN